MKIKIESFEGKNAVAPAMPWKWTVLDNNKKELAYGYGYSRDDVDRIARAVTNTFSKRDKKLKREEKAKKNINWDKERYMARKDLRKNSAIIEDSVVGINKMGRDYR